MREDVVTPAMARRLAQAGLRWDPQIGDWCTVLGGMHFGEGEAGLWLVMALVPATGTIGLVDAAGRWPPAQVAARDCEWLPTAGKLKMWLRGQGYRTATGEIPTRTLGASAPMMQSICRVSKQNEAAALFEVEERNEAEAVAMAVLQILGAAASPPSSLPAW